MTTENEAAAPAKQIVIATFTIHLDGEGKEYGVNWRADEMRTMGGVLQHAPVALQLIRQLTDQLQAVLMQAFAESAGVQMRNEIMRQLAEGELGGVVPKSAEVQPRTVEQEQQAEAISDRPGDASMDFTNALTGARQ